MVRMENNPSGSRPNFFGRQHLTFDKGGKGDSAFRGIVRFWEGWCGARDSAERGIVRSGGHGGVGVGVIRRRI